MPEIKNTFLQGKMNKDLDERLIPNGQYRDAVNIEVSTSEGSDVGAVKNILGNKRIEEIVPEGFKCVGSVANEKTNKLYWFISKYNKDAIIEHDITNDKINPVIVDLNAANSKAVLKFSGNIITGINIINNLLFWTDNNSEPKKINIDECKKGTPDLNTHTQLNFENGSFIGMTINHVAPKADTSSSGKTTGRWFWFEKKTIEQIIVADVPEQVFSYGVSAFLRPSHNNPYPVPYKEYLIRHFRKNRFIGRKRVKLFHGDQGTAARTEFYSDGFANEYHVGDTIFGNGISVDVEERHITVIKPKPITAPAIKINHTHTLDSPSNIPNLFETTFPRFSYRYKYRDGEFSAFAPFTQPVFNPKYTKNPKSANNTNVFYTKDNAYSSEDPVNKAMVNSIHSIEITDFITAETPKDVVEVEILYKQEDSSIIYSITTIKQTSSEWHDFSNYEGSEIGLRKAANGKGYLAVGGNTKGKYTITTENIQGAIPANQLLRPWDNVPRKALGQEMTGSRIVYGNYLQNYNLGNIKPEIKAGYNDRKNQLGTFESKGLPSIKSQRNYQLGVVYSDKYGRETPVFSSKKGSINIPWQKPGGDKNASKSLQLNALVATNFPDWVDSFKIFIKETSSSYYNLVMDRAWVAKSTYELDRGEHLWISFPSSDRNKISEDDYIILKKKIGTDEKQISFENKFKVIDIANEAPDAIKYELVNMGIALNNDLNSNAGNHWFTSSNNIPQLFPSSSRRPDNQTDQLIIDYDAWKHSTDQGYRAALESPLAVGDGDNKPSLATEGLYISWGIQDSSGAPLGLSSQKYKVSGGWRGTGSYVLQLSTKITKADADIADKEGDSDGDNGIHNNLYFQVEKRILKDSEDFSGKFFVKISKNQVTDLIEDGTPQMKGKDVLKNYIIPSKMPAYYWQDDVGSKTRFTSSSYGLTNFGGQDNDMLGGGANSIHSAHNNDDVGNVNPIATIAADGVERKLSDDHLIWDGILVEHGPTFFVDAMHMVAGQSEASNQAKYCCVTWSGAQKGNNSDDPEGSAWSYPPLKTWLTEWVDSENVIVNLNDAEVGKGKYYDAIDTGLIDTSPLNVEDDDFKREKEDGVGVKVTGWVGSSQAVDRYQKLEASGDVYQQTLVPTHVNGLEGIVTTNSNHADGPRRWFSGITGSSNEHGAGVDTNTYSDNGETDRHFMHLSFFAPGKDLHNGSFTQNGVGVATDQKSLFSEDAIGSRLQGIWGGGVFTGKNPKHLDLLAQDRFGSGDVKFSGLPMEGNYDPATNGWLPQVPGPGVGFGYDLDYQELHERQWDPTFNRLGDADNKIRDFIKNLHAGSQFKFSGDTLENVYTIKKVAVKKLYNHTSWRTPFNRDDHHATGNYYHPPTADVDILFKSVEETALLWLDGLADNGESGDDATETVYSNFTDKIVDFGKASNRRVCYIIELDKNPCGAASTFNPLTETGSFGENGTGSNMTADFANEEFNNIEFLEKVQSTLLAGLDKFPAIWETDPKKQQVDLDIYYEASNNIPVTLNKRTNELIAPVGCTVQMLGQTQHTPVPIGLDSFLLPEKISHLSSWNGTTATIFPGLPVGNDTEEIEYSGIPFKFTKEDGSYIILIADEQQLLGESVSSFDRKTTFVFRHDIGDNIQLGLAWNNCFSFGNGLESNRIRDGFNEIFIANGVKASTTTQQTYEEEHRASGLIYSGLYNSNSGVNDLNQFIMAEKITKDLNPTYGSIQKLFSRNSDLVTICEDKVIKVLANKDAVFNADGNTQLTANTNVLGQAIPFSGEFGISTNPESFASESYRAYFTDKQRGVVLRLSKDGLTPISKAGMQDYFRDNLENYDSLIGSYDSYKEDYNITLSHKFGENFIFNSYFDEGLELTPVVGSLLNFIVNPGISGSNFQYSYDISGNKTTGSLTGAFEWGPPDTSFGSEVLLTNHPAIQQGQDQQAGTTADVFTAAIVDYNVEIAEAVPATYSTIIYTGDFGDGVAGDFYTGDVTDVINTSVAFGTDISGGINVGTADYGSGGTFTLGLDASATSGADADAVEGSAAIFASSDDTDFAYAGYNLFGNLDDGGIYYNPTNLGYGSSSKDIFGPSASGYLDANLFSNVTRVIDGLTIIENSSTFFDDLGIALTGNASWYQQGQSHNPYIEKIPRYDENNIASYLIKKSLSQCVTRNENTGGILFDRAPSSSSHVEFNYIGNTNNNPSAGVNGTYASNAGITSPHQQGLYHSSFFNGDELHVEFDLTCYKTNLTSYYTNIETYGFNFIQPKLELFDGATGLLVDSDMLITQSISLNIVNTAANVYYTQYTGAVTAMGLTPRDSGNALGDYSSNASGSTDFKCVKGMSGNSASVIFPETNPIGENPDHQGGWGTFTVTCGASFKFKDPAQQNDDGTYNGSNTDGNQITETKVVEDLRIRISDVHDGDGNAQFNSFSSLNHPYKNPLWEINNLKAVKGLGITSPSTAFDAGEILQDVPEVIGSAAIGTYAYTYLIAPGSAAEFGDVEIAAAFTTAGTSIPAIPPEEIPAWVEVTHQGMGASFTLFQSVGAYPSNNTLGSVTDGGYGPSYSSSTGNVSQETYTTIDNITHTYLVPDGTQDPTLYPASQTGAVSIPGQYLEINNSGATDAYHSGHLDCQMSDLNPAEEWVTDRWYLVDVEYDELYNNSTGADGSEIAVFGVLHGSAVVGDNLADNPNSYFGGGVGEVTGDYTHKSAKLVPVTRTEYGVTKTVLRTIFRMASSSERNTDNNTRKVFRLRFKGFGDGKSARITKLIVKRADAAANDIMPDNWYHATDFIGGLNVLKHSFTKKEQYYKNNSICWDIAEADYSQEKHWKQNFPANYLTATPGGWSLRFTVANNPDYPAGDHTGNLRVTCSNDLGVNGFEGLYFENLTDPGNYELKFNFSDNLNVTADEPWGAYLNGSPYSGAIVNYISSVTSSASAAAYGNSIFFAPTVGADSDFRMSISELSLIDKTLIFQGGTSGSWNWAGFFTSLQSYISWDDIENSDGIANNRIQFGEIDYLQDPNTGDQIYDVDTTSLTYGDAQFSIIDSCPFVDPLSTEEFKTPISASQFINRTINRYEKYNIEFEHGITQGELDIYYFNNKGYGFRIPNINENTPLEAQFTVVIGQDQNDTTNEYSEKRSSQHPAGQIYSPELQETFVISPSAFNAAGDNITASNEVQGWIDGITMTRIYDIELGPDGITPMFEEKTVTFSEGVNGWTSFKSFVPESGVSLSKKYFTFDKGKLYKHYVPLKYNWSSINPGFISSTLNEAENYNIFYGEMLKDDVAQKIKATEKAKSKIKFVLNNEPSTIKMFNTLNYEGTQSYISLPEHADFISINNAEAWQEGANIEGWKCEGIESDLDTGSVIEFIKKEGKWFNYIKGGITPYNQNIDTSLFSIQGIGTTIL